MAVRVKVDLLERDVAVVFDQTLGPKARSKYLADYARQELKYAQNINRQNLGATPLHETFVDGRKSNNLDAVKPDGEIVFEFELLGDLFAWIGAQLIKHSPVGRADDPRPDHPGLYRRSHVFIADDKVVDPGAPLPMAQEYVFVNTQPYARKIERGLSNQAPDGVYQVIATLANRRFSNLARIRFSYRDPIIGAIDKWANTTQMQTKRKGAKRDAWLRRQPAIVITSR